MKKICMLVAVLMVAFITAINVEARPGGLPDLTVDETIKACDCKLFPQCCAQPVVAPAPAPTPEPVKEKVTITLKVLFDTDKAIVKDKYSNEIKRVADFMKKYPETKGSIDGHTDNVGADDYNKKLSEARANSVRQYLIDKFGIDGSRLTAAGYGESKPIADNNTAEGKQKNRRVEAVLETVTIVK